MDWLNTTSTSLTCNTACDVTADIDTTFTVSTPDPLIDWFPNSCLYTKYVPTWHLVKSYRSN